MKSTRTHLLAIFSLILSINPSGQANAADYLFENIKVTVPDVLEVTGQEVGVGSRKCLLKATADALNGSTIPLRAGIYINLRDALGATVDNGYAVAEVEGLKHLDIRGAFNCDATNGTLKSPYSFTIMLRGAPTSNPFGYTAPVTLNFVPAQAVAPKPIPSVTATPEAISQTNQIELNDLNSRLATMKSENDSLKLALARSKSSVELLNLRLKKICSVKPKPKFC